MKLLTCFTIDNTATVVSRRIVVIVIRIILCETIAVFFHAIHIAKQSRYGNIPNRFLEKQQFNCRRTNCPKRWQEKEKTTKSCRLPWITKSYMVRKNTLCLILQHLNWLNITKLCCFYFDMRKGLDEEKIAFL